jgi:hypothetical protein
LEFMSLLLRSSYSNPNFIPRNKFTPPVIKFLSSLKFSSRVNQIVKTYRVPFSTFANLWIFSGPLEKARRRPAEGKISSSTLPTKSQGGRGQRKS